jgi:hypothetical protein
MGELVAVVGIALVVGVGGIVLGMLVAPRIGRLAERAEDPPAVEEPGDAHEP